MKILRIGGFLVLAALLIAGCGGKYADVKKVNEKYITAMETYVSDLEAAKDASQVAKAMDQLADSMEKLMPEMKRLSEKYPELQDHNNPPEELAEISKQAEAVGMKMGSTMMKVMPHMSDPEVQKAQERLSKVMMEQGK
jgi:thiamine biosynthesis lipoprotein ApbE